MEQYLVTDESLFTKQDVSNVNITNVTSITGPMQIDILQSNYFDCNLFLFSDVHVFTKNGFKKEDSGSLYLPLYLDALFKKYPNKQFDLMVEFGLHKEYKELIIQNGLIRSLTIQFDNCYKGFNNKSDCNKEFKNVRFHNVDVRKYFDELKREQAKESFYWYTFYTLKLGETAYFLDKYETLSNNEIDDIDYIFKEMSDNIYEILLGNNKNITTGRYVLKKIYSDSKFKKYKNIKYVEYINDFIEYQINKEVGIYNVFDMIKKLNNKKVSSYEVQSLMVTFKYLLTEIRALCMDYYSLIRFMKILSYGGKNILYLAGGYHIENFKNFLRSMDKQIIIIKGSYEINDELYNMYVLFINNMNMKRLIGYTKYIMRIKSIIRILQNLLEFLIKNKDEKSIYVMQLLKIFNNNQNMILHKSNQYTDNPDRRIIKINSYEIEQHLK